MRKIKNKKVEIVQEEIAIIKCDVCGKEYDCENKSIADDMEIQEFLHIDFRGGYGSIFGDGNNVTADICQHCLDDKLGEFLQVK